MFARQANVVAKLWRSPKQPFRGMGVPGDNERNKLFWRRFADKTGVPALAEHRTKAAGQGVQQDAQHAAQGSAAPHRSWSPTVKADVFRSHGQLADAPPTGICMVPVTASQA